MSDHDKIRAYLEDLLTAMGQMNRDDDKRVLTMQPDVRRDLIHRGWWEIVPILDRFSQGKE